MLTATSTVTIRIGFGAKTDDQYRDAKVSAPIAIGTMTSIGRQAMRSHRRALIAARRHSPSPKPAPYEMSSRSWAPIWNSFYPCIRMPRQLCTRGVIPGKYSKYNIWKILNRFVVGRDLPGSWKQLHYLAEQGKNAIQKATGRKYRCGSISQLTKRTFSGSIVDYTFGVQKVPFALVMELPASNIGFQPSTDHINPLGRESWIGIKAMCLQTLEFLQGSCGRNEAVMNLAIWWDLHANLKSILDRLAHLTHAQTRINVFELVCVCLMCFVFFKINNFNYTSSFFFFWTFLEEWTQSWDEI